MFAIIVFVVDLFRVAFSCIWFALSKPASPDKPATPPAPAMEKKTEMKSETAKTTRITGEVTSVDSKAGTLTVKTKDKEANLIADSNAKGALGKVKVGDMVKVTYAEKDGKMLASSIAGAKAKKSAKATAK